MLKFFFKIAALLCCAASTAMVVDAAQKLHVRHVVCEGTSLLNEADVYKWLKTNLPKQMIFASPEKLTDKLMASLPLADVAIKRNWPAEIHINITERQPFAMVIEDDKPGWIVVDQQGLPASYRQDQDVAIWNRPVIRGCALPLEPHQTSNCIERGVIFLAWLDVVAPQWLDQISDIRVEGEAIKVYLLDGVSIDFGSAPYEPKLRALQYSWEVAKSRGLAVYRYLVLSNNRVVLETNQGPLDQITPNNQAKKIKEEA